MLKYRLLLIFDGVDGPHSFECVITAPDKCSAYDQAVTLVERICSVRYWCLTGIHIVEYIDTRN